MAHKPTDDRNGIVKSISERELQQAVMDRLRLAGYQLVYHTQRSYGSETGFPDLTAAKKGGPLLLIEIKREDEQLTTGRVNPEGDRWLPGQDEWLETLATCPGVRARVVRPSDWLSGEFEKWLGERR